MGLDGQILLWIQEYLRTPFMDALMSRFTVLGDHGMMWILLTLVLLIIPKTRKVGIICFISLALSVIFCNGLLKNLVGRPRPYTLIPDLKLLVKAADDASVPSGHSSAAFCTATVCLLKLPKKAGIPLIIVAAAQALSRLYVGIHYPTDVLAGTILGIILALCAIKIAEFAEKKGWLKKVPGVG